jgi:hypothetical protein
MKFKFNIMHNGPALDLPISRQAKVINFNYLQITCCSPRFWCNRLLGYYKIPQGAAMDSGQRGEANIRAPDVGDQAIRTALDEQPFSSLPKITKRTCIPITIVWWRLTNSISFVVKHLRWYLINWTMQNWQQKYIWQTNSWQPFVRLSIKNGNISLLLMNHGFIYQ